MADDERLAELQQEYAELMHAVQSGVAAEMAISSHSVEPKHLRVGINSAQVNDAALVRLLIEKGVFTELEYFEHLVTEARREKERYERLLSTKLGPVVNLG